MLEEHSVQNNQILVQNIFRAQQLATVAQLADSAAPESQGRRFNSCQRADIVTFFAAAPG